MPRPPSTGSVTPVMNEASSEARNAIALATSSAVPGRPRACVVFECSKKLAYASSVIPARLWQWVMMTPGFTALTRTPFGANSNAEHRVSWSTAALLIQ
ncbi:Uncharacterized protein APZ42_015968 [Daphnia magna]|uniref:Uncharacterized protein n=1 Tax=Daphnia magna TaxID=35525 RepID=A0A162NFW8_9CRUS|nr:Uncharacterized protein APZ42_015968 [Daphnia magna]